MLLTGGPGFFSIRSAWSVFTGIMRTMSSFQRVLCFGLVALFASAAFAQKPDPVRFLAVGHVVRVISDQEVIISRGKKHGLTAEVRLVFAHRKLAKDGKNHYIDHEKQSASGKVIELGDGLSRVSLSEVKEPVVVGDYVGYTLTVPFDNYYDAVFRVAAADVRLRALNTREQLLDFAPLFAGQASDATVKTLVAEIKKHVELAKQVHNTPIAGGRFHGLVLSDAFDKTTDADMLAFLDFVATYPGKYLALEWKLVNVYATWIINATPTGSYLALKQKTVSLNRLADAALERGDFLGAASAYQAVLAVNSDQKSAQDRLDHLDSLRRAQRALADDPEDSDARWKMAKALFSLEHYPEAHKQLLRLEAIGFLLPQTRKYIGYCLVRLDRHDDAIEVFEGLIAEQSSPHLVSWRDFAKAEKATRGKDPAQAFLTLGRINEDEDAWDSAQARYQKALAVATSPEQMQAARAGLARVARRQDLDRVTRALDEAIEAGATDFGARLKKVVEEYLKRDDLNGLLARLDTSAELARTKDDSSQRITIQRHRLQLAPDRADVMADLAQALARSNFTSEGLEWADKAIAAAPDDAYVRRVRSSLAAMVGDLDRAQELAKNAEQTAPMLRVQCGIAAARGEWEVAREFIVRARQKAPDEPWFGRAYEATMKGVEAAKALALGKDVEKNRLRLVRSLAKLSMGHAALAQMNRIKNKKLRAEAAWFILYFRGADVPAEVVEAAAGAVVFNRPIRKLHAQAALLGKTVRLEPDNSGARVELAGVWVQLGHFRRALAALGQVAGGKAHNVRMSVERGERAHAHFQRGIAARKTGDVKQQLTHFQAARDLYDGLGATAWMLDAGFYLAAAHSRDGNLSAAEAQAERQLKLARAWGDPFTEVDNRLTLAEIQGRRGSMDALDKALKKNLVFCREQDHGYCEAVIRHRQTKMDRDLGRYASALEHGKQAMKLYEELGYPYEAGNAMLDVAAAQRRAGQTEAAAKMARKVLTRAQKDGDTGQERMALLELGAIALRRADARRAQLRFDEVKSLGARTGDNKTRATAQFFIGKTRLALIHDPELAAEAFDSAATLFGRLKMRSKRLEALLGLAAARRQQDKPGEAEALARAATTEATALKRVLLRTRALSELARALTAQGEHKEAARWGRSATRAADKTEDDDVRWQAWYALGKALEGGADLEGARKALLQAVDVLAMAMGRPGGESAETYLAVGEATKVFDDTVDLLYRMGRTDEALGVVQRRRGINLKQMFDPSQIKSTDPKAQRRLRGISEAGQRAAAARDGRRHELEKGEKSNETRVKAWGRIAAQSDGELSTLLTELKRDQESLYNMMTVNPRNLTKQRETLPEGAVVVEYLVAETAIYIFVVAKDDQNAFTARVDVPVEEVERRTRLMLDLMDGRSALATPHARQLYKWLLEPVAEQLEGAKTVLVMPFGVLHYVPFNALVTTPEGEPPGYALERYRIAVVSEGTLPYVLQKKKVRKARRTVVAFANPDGTLPDAEKEVLAMIEKGFPKGWAFVGDKATKERFLATAGNFDIMHFATHGVLDADPLASHLKLASSDLTVKEISGVTALERTSLVVLSACETGVEKRKKSMGDEAISLAHAFAAGGARASVASLWKVDDAATSELMSAFYKRLGEGQTDVLGALRQAQLRLLRMEVDGDRPYADPEFWAGFIMVGDYR